jgi:hypothetical protein
MADPVYVECSSACTVTVDIQAQFPPFNLSESDGAQIAGAILAVWAVAWAFRALVRHLRSSDGDSSSTSESE